ncbi:hypothetical protein N781_09480 [Pontibacillus halophilus JSM 076056 = DSM 19796]|uniref:DUF4097 domain-containing protein n=1 Tax=Pontibacillus halophilus JSM 076056 = DSM 19796 TaxID=1385510 RepID=A0A0A5G9L6_9BACI|nr:DUF4097 family beta strand repeat-containing protein [Pontibacillus halophilus]KGX88739.1 hypothetical protein N781_09480 [Pontibacillus halophilus JSM 076056 = DSM 19796]
MKKLVYFAIASLVVGVIGVSAILAGGIDSHLANAKVKDEKKVSAEGVTDLSIDVKDADITLIKTDSDEVTAELSGRMTEKKFEDVTFTVEKNGGKVSIVERTNFSFEIGFTMLEDLDLNVYLPEQVYESLTIQATSADIQLPKLDVNNVLVDVTSGDIITDGMENVTTLEMHTTSGDIRGKAIQAESGTLVTNSGDLLFETYSGNLSIQATSGDVTIKEADVQSDVSIETTSGDIAFHYAEEPTSLNLVLDTTSGDKSVQLEGISFNDDSNGTVKNQIGDGENTLSISATSGDITIQ